MKAETALIVGAVGLGAYVLWKGGIGGSINDISEGTGDIIGGASSLIKDVGGGAGNIFEEVGAGTGDILNETAGTISKYLDYQKDWGMWPFTQSARDNVSNKFFGFGQSAMTAAQSAAKTTINSIKGLTGAAIISAPLAPQPYRPPVRVGGSSNFSKIYNKAIDEGTTKLNLIAPNYLPAQAAQAKANKNFIDLVTGGGSSSIF